jgi:nicotinate-nucleotide adenylyltransferase
MQLKTDTVVFVPAKCSPLKGVTPPMATNEDRLAMIALAIDGIDGFAVSDWELNRPAPSYTIDTVHHFRAEYGPETAVYWLLGADSINDIVRWYKVTELIDTCHLAFMYRGGYKPPSFEDFVGLWGPERVEKLRRDVVETPRIAVSSTQIRRKLATGENVDEKLAPAVAEYIRRRGLYRCA